MVKSELIKALASRMTYLPERAAEEAVNLILASMSQALVNGQRIEIRGFGSFSVGKMPGRAAHNPKTGERAVTPPKNKVSFKPGLELRQRIIQSQKRVALEENGYRQKMGQNQI